MFADADFAGMWSAAHDEQDLACAREINCCPLLLCWSSKLQTEIAISTLEAEFTALSNVMCDLIPARLTLQAIGKSL
jgi:hypothetical protein